MAWPARVNSLQDPNELSQKLSFETCLPLSAQPQLGLSAFIDLPAA